MLLLRERLKQAEAEVVPSSSLAEVEFEVEDEDWVELILLFRVGGWSEVVG